MDGSGEKELLRARFARFLRVRPEQLDEWAWSYLDAARWFEEGLGVPPNSPEERALQCLHKCACQSLELSLHDAGIVRARSRRMGARHFSELIAWRLGDDLRQFVFERTSSGPVRHDCPSPRALWMRPRTA